MGSFILSFSSRSGFMLGVLFIGLGLTVSSAVADTLYGITADDNLITIPTGSPSTSTLVGTLDTPSASLGIFSNAGGLYVYDTNNNVVRQVSPTTAATIATINLGITAASEGDIAFNNGVGYLFSNLQPDGSFGTTGTLFRFTLTPGSATVVTANDPFMDGLAFSPTGVLYGLSQGGTSLYTINLTTGVATLVGTGTGVNNDCGGFACFSYGGLSFGTSGTLYATLTNFSSTTSNFYTIDPNTGVATANGTIPFDQVTGLTSLAPITVVSPEPSTVYLVGGSLLLALGLGRQRRRAVRS